jgi:hypothetical protein
MFGEDRQFQQLDADGHVLIQFGDRQIGASIGIGREFGRSAALSAGVRRFAGKVDVTIGDPSIANDDIG